MCLGDFWSPRSFSFIRGGDTIRTINITNARQNLFQLVSDVNIGFNPITIVNNKGKNAVLISENEYEKYGISSP